tara:strand:+ start:275 stop:514 length:240 start_codon:yes stop_codon:yes gene_type:complete
MLIFLIVGIFFIYNTYYNNENKINDNVLYDNSVNKIVNTESYKPFSSIESKGTELDNNIATKETKYTREKTTTGFFNII